MASSSKPSDDKTNNHLALGDPRQTSFLWTQVGSICFPVFTATPISPSKILVGIEIPTVRLLVFLNDITKNMNS